MRFYLARSRRHGVCFDIAWAGAWKRVRWPHDKAHRTSWKEAIDETRDVWESAYENRRDDPVEGAITGLAA